MATFAEPHDVDVLKRKINNFYNTLRLDPLTQSTYSVVELIKLKNFCMEKQNDIDSTLSLNNGKMPIIVYRIIQEDVETVLKKFYKI